jgi:hypothetical protein
MSKTPFLPAASIGMVSSVHFFAETRAERKISATQYFILTIMDWMSERKRSKRIQSRKSYLLYIYLPGAWEGSSFTQKTYHDVRAWAVNMMQEHHHHSAKP